MNQVVLIGRLTKDPELQYANNGNPYTKFTLAVDAFVGGKKRTDFIKVALWNNDAENTVKYVNKGRLISVSGHIRTFNYINASGNKIYDTEVVVDRVKFLDYKKEETMWR